MLEDDGVGGNPTLIRFTGDDAAIGWIEAQRFAGIVESMHRAAMSPDEISSRISLEHGVMIEARLIARWVEEEHDVREALVRNPLVRSWVLEHADELRGQVATDMGMLDDVIRLQHSVATRRDPDLEFVSPKERLKLRLQAGRDLGLTVVRKYSLTDQPIVARNEQTREVGELAAEIYGGAGRLMKPRPAESA